MPRTRLAISLSLLAVLAGGSAAYAGTTGHGDDPEACANPHRNVVGAGVCPVNVDPDVQVAPIVQLPVITDLQ